MWMPAAVGLFSFQCDVCNLDAVPFENSELEDNPRKHKTLLAQ